jgi:hypothetical protein
MALSPGPAVWCNARPLLTRATSSRRRVFHIHTPHNKFRYPQQQNPCLPSHYEYQTTTCPPRPPFLPSTPPVTAATLVSIWQSPSLVGFVRHLGADTARVTADRSAACTDKGYGSLHTRTAASSCGSSPAYPPSIRQYMAALGSPLAAVLLQPSSVSLTRSHGWSAPRRETEPIGSSTPPSSPRATRRRNTPTGILAAPPCNVQLFTSPPSDTPSKNRHQQPSRFSFFVLRSVPKDIEGADEARRAHGVAHFQQPFLVSSFYAMPFCLSANPSTL